MIRIFTVLAVLFASACAQAQEGGLKLLRLYTLDCGSIVVSDANLFSDVEGYDGKTLDLAVPCYVVQHGDSYMLWDAGLPLDFVKGEEVTDMGPYTLTVRRALPESLSGIGLAPADIDYIAISHTHFDHIGQAASFPGAKLLIGKREFEYIFSGEADPGGFNPAFLAPWKDGENVNLLAADHDVFGDGRVVILQAPGHTPGHTSLLLRLEETGPIILSGDLYHFAENRVNRRMPDFNTDRADTLASMDRIEEYAKNIGARLIIQHDKDDYAAQPKGEHYMQ